LKFRVIVFEGESAQSAYRRLQKKLRREAFRDRRRRRSWGVEFYRKPGYVRRQKEFFAKVVAKRYQRPRRSGYI